LPALVLVAVAVWEIAVAARAARAVPHDDAWGQAAAYVRAHHQRGDLIVFAPAWADPIGRLHLGDLISLDMAGRMDDARYGRIWEVAIEGEQAAELAGLAAVESHEADGVTVRRYERPAATIVSDVRDALGAVVAVGGTPRLELAEVGFRPHRCVQVTPVANKPARLTFPQLALGTELVGYVGIADVFTRRDERSPVRLDVEIAGAKVASVTAGVEDGWVRFRAPTREGAADVTFVASASAPNKLICFAAEARR